MKDHLLKNKTQSQISNQVSVLNCCSYCDRSFVNKTRDKSFINIPFLNFVHQWIRDKGESPHLDVLISYYVGTQIMLILILIDVQYSQKAVFSFEKGLNGQIHSSGSHHQVKKSPPATFLISSHFLLLSRKPCYLVFVSDDFVLASNDLHLSIYQVLLLLSVDKASHLQIQIPQKL